MTDTEKAALQKELLATLAWAEGIVAETKRELQRLGSVTHLDAAKIIADLEARERARRNLPLEIKVAKKRVKKTIDALWEGDLG